LDDWRDYLKFDYNRPGENYHSLFKPNPIWQLIDSAVCSADSKKGFWIITVHQPNEFFSQQDSIMSPSAGFSD
jgi:hypothetical protein